MTGGERGDVLNPAMDRPGVRADLPRIRRREMARAREILGVDQRFLGFIDSGLPGDGEELPGDCFAVQPLETAARPLVQAVREFRPHVLVTYDPNGGYPHPDHVKTHQVSAETFAAAGDPDRYPGTGRPWRPLKLYCTCAFGKAYFQAIHEAMTAAGLESPAGELLEAWDDAQPTWETTTRVECAGYFPVRLRALLAHETQVDPDGPERSCPIELEQKAWPTEAGIEVDRRGRVVVDAMLRSVSHPDVHAIGDAAAIRQPWGEIHGTCQSGIPTGAYTADAISRLLSGRKAEPFRFGHSHRTVSLGRRDAVIQFTHPDDTPRRWTLTGRAAAVYKEVVSGSPLTTYRLTSRYPGALAWPRGGRRTRRPADARPSGAVSAEAGIAWRR